jgi:hypothetical protein
MHRRPLAERLLSLAVGAPRASALYGDLEELAPAHGHLWFWISYIRAIVTLGWRTPVAFAISLISMKYIFGTVIPWLVDHITHHLSDPGLFGQENLRTSLVLWNLSMAIAYSLCFVLPFIAVRFGLRNRLTQLACALFLLAVPVYSFTPWVRDLAAILTILVIFVALALPLWRAPLAILAATILTTAFLQSAFTHALVSVYRKNYFLIPLSTRAACDNIAFAMTIIVCMVLHRRLPGEPSSAAPAHLA